MSLTLKDLRVLYILSDHPDPEVRGTNNLRPASLADLVEVLKQEGAEVWGSQPDADLDDVVPVAAPGWYLVLPLGDTA